MTLDLLFDINFPNSLLPHSLFTHLHHPAWLYRHLKSCLNTVDFLRPEHRDHVLIIFLPTQGPALWGSLLSDGKTMGLEGQTDPGQNPSPAVSLLHDLGQAA